MVPVLEAADHAAAVEDCEAAGFGNIADLGEGGDTDLWGGALAEAAEEVGLKERTWGQ